MKKLVFILVIVIIFSCSKDDKTQTLETPSLNWIPTAVANGMLEITVTISSSQELPKGVLKLKVDGNNVASIQAVKGTTSYNTDFSFIDEETHKAILSYEFEDGRDAVIKAINLRKSVQEIVQKPTRNDWAVF